MDMGSRIRELRKKRGLTQEALAEHLNISPQAVSKWENGTAYPDVMLIPRLAAVFEVSTDHLFGIGGDVENDRTREIRAEYERLCRDGDDDGRVALMREALAEYPYSCEFMNDLARSLFRASRSLGEIDEAISLCRTVLLNSRDEAIRCSALQTITRLYVCRGDRETALKYANMLPSYLFSREYALEWALDGDERNQMIQKNALKLMSDLSAKLIARAGRGAGRNAFHDDELEPDKELAIYKSVEALINCVFDGNYGVMGGRLAQLHRFAARCCAKQGDKNGAMEHLYRAEEYADRFEADKNKGIKYTSPFFDRLVFEFSGTRHGDSSEHGRILRKIRQWNCFDFMREDPAFVEYERRIEEKTCRAGQ